MTLSSFAAVPSLEVVTNDAALVRGRSAVAVMGSEASTGKTDETSASFDEEVVAAAVPSLAMWPDGGLMVMGSSVIASAVSCTACIRGCLAMTTSEDILVCAIDGDEPRLNAEVVERALADDGPRARADMRAFGGTIFPISIRSM